jgi:hypothetical protein
MAGVKISGLPLVPSAQLTDFLPIVQSATTQKETLQQILTLFNSNIQLLSAAQVSGLPATLNGLLPLSGGTMTGPLILSGTPVLPLEAATKAYADSIAAGFTVILAADAGTTANLNVTQAGAGIGATLTDASGTFAAFSVDGISPSLNSRILVKNQTLTEHNGVYVLTTNGDGVSVPYVLTRSTDYDTALEIKPGTLVAVNNGTVNANTSWLETATVVTVDTDPVLFSQFTFSPGSFFLISNNLSEGVQATKLVNLGLGTPTGTGNVVLQTSPTLITPVLGNAEADTLQLNNASGILDINGNILLAINPIPVSVNYLSINNQVTGFPPGFIAAGTDADIGIILFSKGTSGIYLKGFRDGSAAQTDYVGETLSSVVTQGSPVVQIRNTAINVTSISLSPGDWDVWGNATIVTSGTTPNGFFSWISTISATLPSMELRSGINLASGSIANGTGITASTIRVNVSSTTTVYLGSYLTNSSGNGTVCGQLYARRRR